MDTATEHSDNSLQSSQSHYTPYERTPLISNDIAEDSPSVPNGTFPQQQYDTDPEQSSSKTSLDEPSVPTVVKTMCCLWLSVFIAALDSTVVATLSAPISSSFQSGASFTWIASGYLISNAACQPISGKLTDIYGRRAGLVFASTSFAIGTLICGIAPNASTMILGRVIAGIGGGCVNAVSVFIGSDLVPLRIRGVITGLANVVWGLGTGLGGLYGGLVNDYLHWRYAFLIQVPFIVIGATLAVWMIKLPQKENAPKLKRVDFLGALTLTTFLVLVLVGLSAGGNTVPFSHPLVYVTISLGLLFLALFVYVEEKVSLEPIIPVSQLLSNRTILAACLALWFETMGMFMLIYYIPIYFQVIRSVSAVSAGTVFIPQSAGTALGSLGAGLYIRSTGRYRLLGILSGFLWVTAPVCIFFFFHSASPVLPYVLFGLAGLAYGAILTVAFLAMISTVDRKWQAVVTGTSYAFRSTGSTMGIAGGTAIFQNLLRGKLKALLGDLPTGSKAVKGLMDSFDYIDTLPARWRPGIIESYVQALDGVWLGSLGLAALTLVAMVFLRENKLYNNVERSN